MDELLKHKNEEGAIGDLARELIVIIDEFKQGGISLEEKNQLVEEVTKIYAEHEGADREIVARWAVTIASTLTAIV